MTEFFEHTPQTTDVVNQVENLATEVSDAFNIVEEILFQDSQKNASINSSIGDLDNQYIKEYVPNRGWILNYSQNLYFPTNSQSASLDLYPSFTVEDLNTVAIRNLMNPSVTYEYQHSGILSNDTDFTFVDRKVILGRSPTENDNLVITYKGFNTTTPDDSPDDWEFELKYNVLQIKNYDNSIIKEFPVTKSGNVYSVTGYNFKSLCSSFIQNVIETNPQDLDKYVSVYENEERVSAYNYEITNTFFRFVSEKNIENSVKIYVANSSLGKLVECLYRLFYAHDHGSNGGNGVNHNAILGLYENTDNINYESTNKSNYDHPQYLNREGYITDGTVYNNAVLGDLLLASTSDYNRKNNLDTNSVKLIFGEYNSGSRMYYNSSDDCLWLDSISRDGIKLVSPLNKKILSLNDHSFVDTHYISSGTNKSLKLALKTSNDTELGVFQLTRKVVNDEETTDDDKAKFLSYASEFTLTLIKEKLTIDNGAKISFGNPSIIDLVLDDTGLHFKAEGEGELTDITTVHFDVPVKAKKMTVEHLDAKGIHITETQRLEFGNDSHTEVKTQYVNYTNNKLNLKTEKAVNFASNGRQTGISLDDRHYIYAATAQGFPILDQIEYTDLFLETKRDTYFIQSGYVYNPGVTSLHSVPRSNTYCNTSFVNTLAIEYNETAVNGILLSANNKIFAQRDLTENISTIFQSNTGVIVAASYNPVGPVITYGKITAKTYVAEGSKDTDAGFYGNIIVPINNRLTINGTTEFNSDIVFNKGVTFTDKVTANIIDAQVVNTNALNVSDKATYNNVEVLEELRFNTLLQTNRTANSSFEGTVQFNNNVTIPDSNNFLVIGNKEIEDNRKVSGVMISSNRVRLGTNGVLEAGKILATKGTPSGNGDTTGGYSFASTNGIPDGDTGFFAEENIEEQSNSDLVFRIDGIEKGRFLKEPLDLDAIDLSGKEKAVVTLDILLSQISNLTSNTLDTVYPIGTIYENSVDGRNPTLILNWPGSVWKRYAVGRSLMGASGSGNGEQTDPYLNKPADLNTDSVGTKYGDYQHKLTVAQMPSTTEQAMKVQSRNWQYGPGKRPDEGFIPNWDGTNAGGGLDQMHNNTHPIIITNIWERVG